MVDNLESTVYDILESKAAELEYNIKRTDGLIRVIEHRLNDHNIFCRSYLKWKIYSLKARKIREEIGYNILKNYIDYGI